MLVLAGVFIVRHHEESKKKAEAAKRKTAPTPVSAAPIRTGDIGVHLDALGTVTPMQTVTVKSRVAGQLVALHFTEGQIVKQNDLLAEIDPAPFLASVKQAEGQLARDQAQLENARLDLARYRTVFQQHAIPEQQVRTQEATVHQAEGTVKVDEGALDNAHAQLNYASIRSPLDGRVGLRLVDVGNMINPTDATGLMVITQLKPITVVFSIPEDQVGEVATEMKRGPQLSVEAWDRDQHAKLADGHLLTIDNQIDTSTGTVKLKAIFDNAHDELFPNQFVNAKLLVKTLPNSTLVPTAAIQRAGDKASVFVIGEDNKVESKEVQVVTTDGDTTAVTGVKAGENVVTDGFEKLQSGSQVQVRSPNEKASDDNARADQPAPNGKKGAKGGKEGRTGKKNSSDSQSPDSSESSKHSKSDQ